jgi:hypothetical protein
MKHKFEVAMRERTLKEEDRRPQVTKYVVLGFSRTRLRLTPYVKRDAKKVCALTKVQSRVIASWDCKGA